MIWKSSKLRNSMRQKNGMSSGALFRRSPLVERSQQSQEKPLARPRHSEMDSETRWRTLSFFLKQWRQGRAPCTNGVERKGVHWLWERSKNALPKDCILKLHAFIVSKEFLEKNTPHTTWVWEKKYFSTWEHCHNTHNRCLCIMFTRCTFAQHTHVTIAHTIPLSFSQRTSCF